MELSNSTSTRQYESKSTKNVSVNDKRLVRKTASSHLKDNMKQMRRRSSLLNMETRTKRYLGIKVIKFMGAGGFAQKHEVGILFNKKWKSKIIQTKYVSERMITTTIKCDHHKTELTRCTSRRSTKTESHCNHKKHIPIIAGDFNALFGLGIDSERDYVGEHTTGQSNKRGICKAVLNTTFKKSTENSTRSDPQNGRETAGLRGK